MEKDAEYESPNNSTYIENGTGIRLPAKDALLSGCPERRDIQVRAG